MIDTIYGDVDPSIKAEMEASMKNLQVESLKPVQSELPKTPKEIKMIDMVNQELKKYMVWLGEGVEWKGDISYESFHIIPDADYQQIDPDEESIGLTKLPEETVYIPETSRQNPARELGIITHEAIELMIYRQYRFNSELSPIVYRQGYKTWSLRNSGEHHFLGLKEAVIERMAAMRLLEMAKRDDFKELGLEPADIEKLPLSYSTYIKTIDIIATKIENHSGRKRSASKFHRDLIVGLFNGNMLFLKKIEEAFGPHSLRVLALMGSPIAQSVPEFDKIIKSYFEMDNEEERKNIAVKLLSSKSYNRGLFRRYYKNEDGWREAFSKAGYGPSVSKPGIVSKLGENLNKMRNNVVAILKK